MKYMTEIEIKAWEKAVEIAFAKWIFLEAIIKQNSACLKSIEFNSQDPDVVRTKVNEVFAVELQEKDLYIPLAGNMEKILGDAVSIYKSSFSLLEIKASLTPYTARREWDAPTKNSKNKDRGALLSRIYASDPTMSSWFMDTSKQCHFVMGLQENSNDKFQYDDITFCPYWPFIDPTVKAPHGEKLGDFLGKGVQFPEFSAYIDMLLVDAQNFQEDECEKLVNARQIYRDSIAAIYDTDNPELREAEEKLIQVKNDCDNIKKLNRWTLKNVKVKLVVQNKGTVRTFDTTLPQIKTFLLYVQNKQKPKPSIPTP